MNPMRLRDEPRVTRPHWDEDDLRRLRRKRRRLIAARKGLAVVPTLLTLGNLLCGCAAIFFASRPVLTAMPLDWTPLTLGAVFIFLGMLFDALDGRVARLTHSTSDFGEQLDSMADMVSFGVAPAFLAVQLIGVQTPFIGNDRADWMFDRVALVVGGIYVLCAALRLARFNIELGDHDVDDHLSFKGLPSPGAAGTVASLALLHQHFLAAEVRKLGEMVDVVPTLSMRLSAVVMVAVMLLAAVAMTSRLRYVHVVSRYVRGRAPLGTIAKAMIVALLLAVWPQAALATAFVGYAVSAPAAWAWKRTWRRRATPAAG